jgi:hypothetical protein
MCINSTSKGLHHPSFKSLISAKKFGSAQWAIVQYEFRIRITRRIRNRIRKNLVKWTGAQMGRLMNKTRGQKSHATVPFNSLLFIFISLKNTILLAVRLLSPNYSWLFCICSRRTNHQSLTSLFLWASSILQIIIVYYNKCENVGCMTDLDVSEGWLEVDGHGGGLALPETRPFVQNEVRASAVDKLCVLASGGFTTLFDLSGPWDHH